MHVQCEVVTVVTSYPHGISQTIILIMTLYFGRQAADVLVRPDDAKSLAESHIRDTFDQYIIPIIGIQ